MNRSTKNLLLNNLVTILLFYVIYVITSNLNPANYTIPLDPFNALYFTVTTHSTVGYGDIGPKTSLGKAIVCSHLICILLLSLNFYYELFGEHR